MSHAKHILIEGTSTGHRFKKDFPVNGRNYTTNFELERFCDSWEQRMTLYPDGTFAGIFYYTKRESTNEIGLYPTIGMIFESEIDENSNTMPTRTMIGLKLPLILNTPVEEFSFNINRETIAKNRSYRKAMQPIDSLYGRYAHFENGVTAAIGESLITEYETITDENQIKNLEIIVANSRKDIKGDLWLPAHDILLAWDKTGPNVARQFGYDENCHGLAETLSRTSESEEGPIIKTGISKRKILSPNKNI